VSKFSKQLVMFGHWCTTYVPGWRFISTQKWGTTTVSTAGQWLGNGARMAGYVGFHCQEWR